MDLSSLDSTLPPALADAERDMGDKFRASALNITTMYKSSLGYMKQGYGVGYAACLADVLSTVQSSMSAGQDPSQTLSRLMDWAEARETAMTALANDDDEANHTPYMSKSRPSRTSLARQAMSHAAPMAAQEKDEDPRGRPRQAAMPNSTPLSTESSIPNDGLSTPMSSSPLVHTSNQRPTLKARSSTSHSPSKLFNPVNASTAGPAASTSRLPHIPEFAPSLSASAAISSSASSSSLPTGSKRPLLDVDMTESTSLPASPITPARGPRSHKRRSTGLGVKDEEDRVDRDRDRKRGGRRGHGHGSGHGQGPGGQAV